MKRWVLSGVAVIGASLGSIGASAQTTNLGQWSDTIQFPNVPVCGCCAAEWQTSDVVFKPRHVL